MPKSTPDRPETDSRVDEIRKRYDRYVKRWATIHEELDADLKCLSMEGPWPERERKQRETPGNERPCLHEDVITQFNNMTANQLEMNPMGIDVQPEGEGATEETAEFVESRIRQIEYEQNGQHAYLNASKCAIECSVGFWELETDWSNPFSWDRVFKICAGLDPKAYLVDPDCKKPDWSDMQGAFKISRMTHEDFRQKYPQAEVQDFQGLVAQKQFSGWLDDKSIQVARHWYIEKKKRNLLLLDDGTPEGWTIFEEDLPEVFKKRGKVIRLESDGYADLGFPKGHEYPILKESKRFVPEVSICVTNGIEILEETDWDDEEIPVFIVTGRQKFHQGQRDIESQTRKARTGQLLYDLCISSIQEETAKVPKNLYAGYEGQFDTTTNFATVHREATGFTEFKAVTEEAGSPENPLPIPEIVQREPQIAALLELKQSILIGIQNVLGIASTERKDRASKSGKALEELTEDMNVATSHYHASQRTQQIRMYRMINRMLPEVENTPRDVGLRDVKGNYKTQRIEANHYQQLGQHQVVISSAKYYQSLQEEQSDFAESLLTHVNDPNIMLAVLPDLIRMKGLGPYGDDLAKMVEAMQPPQMQQARQGKEQQISPAMIAQLQQQAQLAIKALNAHAEQIEQERDQLLFEKKAEAEKLKNQFAIESMREKVQLEVAAINQSSKERMDTLDAQVMSIKHLADMLVDKFSLDHTANENALDRAHEQDLAAKQAALAQQQAEAAQEQPANA